MIYNVWGKLEMYCGNEHDSSIFMEIEQKRSGITYSCPYCKNHFTIKDIEKMLDKVEAIINDAEEENEVLDIKNLSFRVGECKYKVLENGSKLKITGVNERAILE